MNTSLLTCAVARLKSRAGGLLCAAAAFLCSLALAPATPANKAALVKHYDRFLANELNRCTTCHLPSANKNPESLDEFPHNPFGHRLRLLGKELVRAGKPKDMPTRLSRVAAEDTDGDGVNNETELLFGHNPGDPKDKPSKKELAEARSRKTEFQKFLASYRWQPFETVKRPPVPKATPHLDPLPSEGRGNARAAALLHPRASEGSGTARAAFQLYPLPAERGEGRQRGAAGPFPIRNPIDVFIAAEHDARKLNPRPEATKEILLRRIYLDLIGLSPTPEEQQAFANDKSSDAYEKVVDRLLADPRYGERWGRHWMDIWRYSDWAGWSGGNQIRDSKPHIWRWRDWIVESLNQNKPYHRLILEMLAADELAPEDTDALRATGFLVRNYKMLSREQWLEDTVKHTAQAFLGLTLGCAKCHDHMFDPISQIEYYQVRAVFEPHQVRTDRVPGQLDTAKDGLVRAYDTDTNAPTYFFIRGDERKADTNKVMTPDVLQVLGGKLHVEPVKLPRLAAFPDKRPFVITDTLAAGETALVDARRALDKIKADKPAKSEKIKQQELIVRVAEANQISLLATLRAEQLEDDGKKDADEWKPAATEAAVAQRRLALAETNLKVHLAQVSQTEAQSKADAALKALEEANPKTGGQTGTEKISTDKSKKEATEKAAKELESAKKKTAEAGKALAEAGKDLLATPTTAFKPRPMDSYPRTSTGRRLAFARWLAGPENPLTARVAMNHIWLRHFGHGIVPTPADFGRNGRPPSHPQLLDWLAAEFMNPGTAPGSSRRGGSDSPKPWSMKHMHRLIVTSSAYRMASTPDVANAKIDPDNVYLWRMNSRRMEAEVVRDNFLYVSGDLDPAMGGPDIDQKQGLTSKRRSLYLRIAAEKEVEFLKIFDGPSVTECYERRPSVMPQQALALANSELTLREARRLAQALSAESNADADSFIRQAFLKILARHPTRPEVVSCRAFLTQQSRRTEAQPPPTATPVADKLAGEFPARPALRACENLVLVLFNHSDFITIR